MIKPTVSVIFLCRCRHENFEQPSLSHHLEVMHEMVRRDKNRPSVIAWSVANEPDSQLAVAEPYFKYVSSYYTPNLVSFVWLLVVNLKSKLYSANTSELRPLWNKNKSQSAVPKLHFQCSLRNRIASQLRPTYLQ